MQGSLHFDPGVPLKPGKRPHRGNDDAERIGIRGAALDKEAANNEFTRAVRAGIFIDETAQLYGFTPELILEQLEGAYRFRVNLRFNLDNVLRV